MATLKLSALLCIFTVIYAAEGALEKGFTDKLKKRFSESSPESAFDIVKTDPLNEIGPEFKIPKFFNESTRFWFQIYTLYTSKDSVLHDREYLSLIYEAVSDKEAQSRPLKTRIKNYKESLKLLAQGQESCELCPKILKSLSRSKLKIPKNKKQRQIFFNKRAESLRFQTGQKDMILKGFDFSAPYRHKINQLIKLYEIPSELLALAFLESSFNTKARSRVGATGVWQFMKVTGQHFMIVTPKNDHRLNPLLSTLAAFQLLKQSRKLLGRWDLAVWSYNSGTPAVQKAQKKLGGTDMTLADMLLNYESERIRFASSNFYSSFLALVHALAYRDYLFQEDAAKVSKIDSTNVEFYVSLCSFRPSWFFSLLEKTSPRIAELNAHLPKRYHQTKYSRGTVLISDRPLTKRRYFKVPRKNYTDRYTKNWRYLIKGRKCRP